MDELRRDVGEDLLRVVAVYDGASPEVIARAAVRGEDRREEPARTRLCCRDRQLAAAQLLVDGPHARDELIERGRALLCHARRLGERRQGDQASRVTK